MLRLIKRLLGIDTTESVPALHRDDDLAADPPFQSHGIGSYGPYFDTLLRMQDAISHQDYNGAALLVRKNIASIPRWVAETRRQHGAFDIPSIPSFQQGGKVLALVGDDAGLSKMQKIVDSIPELRPWAENIQQHKYDLQLFKAIQGAIASHPNCLQTDVKNLIGEPDGRRVANLISYLEKDGRITRTRDGRTHRLASTESLGAPVTPPKPPLRSHRTDSRHTELRELDLSSLTYIPLPRAPLKWEEAQAGREREKVARPKAYFEVRGADWSIESVVDIPLSERPDTAFRQIHPSDSGLMMIDDLGNADGLGQIEAAVLRYDREGNMVLKAGLHHGTYRVGVHSLGRGLIAMSQDCIIHAYDDNLATILETPLTEAPEILALKRRLDIPDDKLKNHIRCVALSRDAGRYLFTAVDEAWCVDITGNGLWGVKLPLKEGWRRVADPSDGYSTSEGVDRALALMGLSFPITPDGIKNRYRELAKRYHPDLNPGNSEAEYMMKMVNLAAETLSGLDMNATQAPANARFVQELDRQELELDGLRVSMTVELSVGEIFASDWIYAASFASESDSVYLASYSGRVVLVNNQGRGIRVYDIGSVPRRIIDTGDYLYLLTDTRLYILRDDELHGLVDTFEGGDLVVAQTGFGLVEKNRVRWFREDGYYLGSAVSQDPIRRVYSRGNAMIVETRKRRATIQGVPAWWE